MFAFAAFRAGIYFPIFFVLIVFSECYPGTAYAGQSIHPEIPDELRQWVPWVLYKQEEKTCTLEATGTSRRYCTWPTRLELEVGNRGATFKQKWIVEARSLVALPGNSPFWPEKVQANGRDIAVVRENDHPAVWLDPGKYLLTGKFFWQQLPEHLFVPPETGFVALTLLGKKVNTLQLDEQGRLWFKHKNKVVKAKEESLSVQVFRRIDDGVPLLQQLRIVLIVSGRPREVTLGLETGDTFVPLNLNCPLPVRLDNRGRMQLQVRPGQWQIQLTLRNIRPRSPEKISQGRIDGAWPDQEIWVFNGDPKLRQIEIDGLFPVDPSRTSLPQDWKNFPAYLIKSDGEMLLHEKHRGNPRPVPNRLQLRRKIWLDENGSGLTTLDRITGTMNRGWRLNVDASLNLGKVEVEGKSRLITSIPGSEKIGVEVRKGSVSLDAESRIEQPVRGGRLVIPALGWDHTVEYLSAVLNLPPGWKLLTASGVDKVSTWLNRWTLLDIFLVLVIALSTARILGWGWGGVALSTLILMYHQPGSPQFMWLPLLGLLALQKIISTATGERFIRISSFVLLAALIISSIPFMVNEVRVGLYPQLEYGRFYPVVREDDEQRLDMQDSVAGAEDPVVMKQASVNRVKEKSRAQKRHYSLQSVRVEPKHIQIDPQAMIQTGPGLPDWNWHTIQLTWNGPVRPEQKVSFILISPLMNTILAFFRVLLLALLLIGFLRQCLLSGKKKTMISSAAALSLLFFFLLPTAFFVFPRSAVAEVPSAAILQELQDRLLASPECGARCAGINFCLIQVDNDVLQVELDVDALIRGAVPLPGKNRFFEQIQLDGQPAEILRLDGQGNSLLRLESGSHHLVLTKSLKGRNKLSFSFPLLPGRGQAILKNWSINGLRDNGKLDTQVSLHRITPAAAEENSEESNKVHLPAYVQVNRTLHMGLKWSLETRVIRRSPDTAIALDIPLLPGERVTTEGLYIKDNFVRVNMEPEQPFFNWHSAMNPVDTLNFSAPETSSWTEVWFLDVSPIWHVETTGIPAINQTNPAGKRFPEFHPYPGEGLQLAISRPDGVPGPVMTITQSKMEIKPGQRATEVTLFFTLTASRGLRHSITLPSDIDLQQVLINNKKYPLQLENNTLVIPIRPGKQDVKIGWRSDQGVDLKLVSPPVDLGVKNVNTSIEMHVPANRWILLVGGPRIGPAVLFWGELLVIILIALLLGRIRFTPLTTLQWLLLSLGLSQIAPPFAAVVVAWLLLLGLRKTKGQDIVGVTLFNLVQILLVILTMAALASLFVAIQQGLLGNPDMQIGGNGSSGHLLRWYQDRSDPLLPAVWAFSVPLLVYRLSMLFWALWLAISLLKWLRWGWDCFSDTVMWRKTLSADKGNKPRKKMFSRHRAEKQDAAVEEKIEQVATEKTT